MLQSDWLSTVLCIFTLKILEYCETIGFSEQLIECSLDSVARTTRLCFYQSCEGISVCSFPCLVPLGKFSPMTLHV